MSNIKLNLTPNQKPKQHKKRGGCLEIIVMLIFMSLNIAYIVMGNNSPCAYICASIFFCSAVIIDFMRRN